MLTGATGMVLVGGSVAVSGLLADAPVFTAQSLRYGLAALLLWAYCRAGGRPIKRPRGSQWGWLLGVTASGLVVFNIALVYGSQHAEPAVLAVAVACVPVALALLGPALEGRHPTRQIVVCAVVVSVGAVLVEGVGRADAVGVLWAVIVFACEAGFTLLAVPVLSSHGPHGVSVHTTWMAAVIFGVVGLVMEGPTAAVDLDTGAVLAVLYLAVGVTAVAFMLWYSCVVGLGAGRAGLLTGIAPIAAAGIGMALTGTAPQPLVWAGIGVIAAGLTLGLRGTVKSESPCAGDASGAEALGESAVLPTTIAAPVPDGRLPTNVSHVHLNR